MARCNVCFRHCVIEEGSTGFCGARACRGGQVVAANYGMATALALDPIEKKPLRRFRPGSLILSVGSYGCNLRCPFCQNHEISWDDGVSALAGRVNAMRHGDPAGIPAGVDFLSPADLAETASYYRRRGNIGAAFTYNEPLIGYEYVRDAAKLIHEKGMVNVLVTNGTAELGILDELAPHIDAMNIDLKGFTDRYYRDVLKGSLPAVKAFIGKAVSLCHVELTTLVIPGENDSEDEMDELSRWVSSLSGVYGGRSGSEIPLHISRFFPRFRMTDRPATDVRQIRRLVETASRHLMYVYSGNC